MFKLIGALAGVMSANIFLSATLAKIKAEFNKKEILNELFKAVCIIIGFLLMIGSAYLSEDIVVATINGVEMNLLEGMKATIVTGIILYSGKDLTKLANLFKTSCKLSSPKEPIKKDDYSS